MGDPAVQCLYLPDEYGPSAARQRAEAQALAVAGGCRRWRRLVSAGAGEGLRALLAGWLGSGSTPARLAALCAGGFGMAAVCLAVQWPLGLGEEVQAILRTEKSRGSGRKARRIGIVLDTGGELSIIQWIL